VWQFFWVMAGPRVKQPEYLRRLAICRGCRRRIDHGGVSYCGSCGCGKWPPAKLPTKVRQARARCPVGKVDSFVKTPSVLDAWPGICYVRIGVTL